MTKQQKPDISSPPVDDKDAARIDEYGHTAPEEGDKKNS